MQRVMRMPGPMIQSKNAATSPAGAGRTPRIVIVGGGFSGAGVALHVARGMAGPVAIDIVEPRPALGGGVAYSSPDPAHRINVPAERMSLFSDDREDFRRWLEETMAAADDEEAWLADGRVFPRRRVFGDYAAERLAQAVASSGATLTHHLEQAVDAVPAGSGWQVHLAGGQVLAADMLVLAVSHPPPRPPKVLAEVLRGHPRFIYDPWAEGALAALRPADEIVIIGTGLTMADLVASLERTGHHGRITAFSRHGLLSRGHPADPSEPFGDFADAPSATALDLLLRIRAVLREAAGRELPWQAVFDAIRRDGQAVWTALPEAERAKLVRHLRAFWDVHRFRVAPQIEAAVARRLAAGSLTVLAAHLRSASRMGGRIELVVSARGRSRVLRADALILATGPGHKAVTDTNPLLRAMAGRGLLRADPLLLGLHVDRLYRVIDQAGRAQPGLLVAGPLARGTFGELMGLPQVTESAEQVAAQVCAQLRTRG